MSADRTTAEHRITHDRSLKTAQNESADGQASKVVTRRRQHQYRTPSNDEVAQHFSSREMLRQITTWPFRNQISKVEYTCQPSILVRRSLCRFKQIKHSGIAQSLFVNVLQQIGSAEQWHESPIDFADEFLASSLVLKQFVQVRMGEVVVAEEDLSCIEVFNHLSGFEVHLCGLWGSERLFFDRHVVCTRGFVRHILRRHCVSNRKRHWWHEEAELNCADLQRTFVFKALPIHSAAKRTWWSGDNLSFPSFYLHRARSITLHGSTGSQQAYRKISYRMTENSHLEFVH